MSPHDAAPDSVIDWGSKPEPWRSVGQRFCAELRGPLAGPDQDNTSVAALALNAAPSKEP